MIRCGFRKGTAVLEAKIEGNKCYFTINGKSFPVETIVGVMTKSIPLVLKEFPDLVGKPKNHIMKEAERRIMDKMSSFKNEIELRTWLVNDLGKEGWIVEWSKNV